MSKIRVKYTCPAMVQPPYDFKIGEEYELINKNKEHRIIGSNFDKSFPLTFIKMCFTPIDKSWDELEI